MPAELRQEVVDLVGAIPKLGPEPVERHTLNVGNVALLVPGRIYDQKPAQFGQERRPIDLAASLLFSRHHSGHVRESCVQHLLSWEDPVVLPYLAILAGEYVREIGQRILLGYGEERAGRNASVIVNNRDLLDVTVARAISYWNEYYRQGYPPVAPDSYEPILFLARLHKAAGLRPSRSVPRKLRHLFESRDPAAV